MSSSSTDENRATSSEQMQIAATLKEHWRKVGYEFPVKSIERIEEAARQLIALNGTLQGLYLAVFAFSNLRDYTANPLVLLFLAPMILSVTSIIFATQVYMPREYQGIGNDDVSLDAWKRISTVHYKAASQKHRYLYRAYLLLISSFVLLIFCIGVARHPNQPPNQHR